MQVYALGTWDEDEKKKSCLPQIVGIWRKNIVINDKIPLKIKLKNNNNGTNRNNNSNTVGIMELLSDNINDKVIKNVKNSLVMSCLPPILGIWRKKTCY